MRHKLAVSRFGTRLQSGIPKGSPANSPLRAKGLTIQGVVTGVYVYDSENGFGATSPVGVPINGIYVDVLCYGKFEGLMPRVFVGYTRQGMHEGEISLPKAASKTINGELNPQVFNPAESDGDHVIIAFAEDDLKKPFISQFIPHPSVDVGNENRLIGHRMRIKDSDGSPRFWKHKGSFWGVDRLGNFIADLTRSHSGDYLESCKEPEPGVDGVAGNYTIRIPENSKLTLEITKGAKNGDGSDSDAESTKLILENNKITILNEGGAGVLIQNKDGNASLTLGDGAVHSAISEHLETLWSSLVTWLTSATVLTALGPSAPFPTLAGPPPDWLATIESSKSSFPDG